MLKAYYSPSAVSAGQQHSSRPVTVSVRVVKEDSIPGELRLRNSDVLSNLNEKLNHLPLEERKELATLLKEFNVLFPATPGLTTAIQHVDVGDATPCKQHPY